MATGFLSPIGLILQAFSDQGVVGAGYKIATYYAGGTTPAVTYTDSTLLLQNSNPIVLGSNGRFQGVSVWAPAGTLLKMVLTDANNNVISGGTIDNLPLINNVTYPQTGAEIAASVVPVNTYIPSHDYIGYVLPARYGVVGDGVTNDTAAWGNFSAVVQTGKAIKGLIPPGVYLIDSWTISQRGGVFEGVSESAITLTFGVKIKARSNVTNFVTVDGAIGGKLIGMEIDGNNLCTNTLRVANQITDFEWKSLTIGGCEDNGVNLNMAGVTTNTAISELGFHDIRLAGCGSRGSGTGITNLLINSDQSLVIAFYRLKHFGNTAGATDVPVSVEIIRGTVTFYTPFATKVQTYDYRFGNGGSIGGVTIIDGRSESSTADHIKLVTGSGDITLVNNVHGSNTNNSLVVDSTYTGRVSVLGGQYNNIVNNSATASLVLANPNIFGTGSIGGTNAANIIRISQNILQLGSAVTSGVGAAEMLLKDTHAVGWANAADTALGGIHYSKDSGIVANNAIVVAGRSAAPNAILIIIEGQAAESAIIMVRGGIHAVSIINDATGTWSTTSGTANKNNIYWSGTQYEIENKRGANRSYTIHVLA